MMIKINLLPKELRVKKVELPNISFLPLVIIVVLVHIILGFSTNMKEKSLAELEDKWQALQPEKKIADELTDELTTKRVKIDAIDSLIQGRMSWAKKLSDLSDVMTPGVWLNRLWLEQETLLERMELKRSGSEDQQPQTITRKKIIKTLHINGSVIAKGGEETAAIGKFIKSLKNNKSFFADYEEVEATSIQRSRLKDIEIMDFELICYFK
ncbi:MAG: hypothetical protein ISS26_00605 [Candidatus Omnitrophica bacterium]|nr:hypothetical protein [Candidatus Omnitrophota bacterium]